MQYILSCPRENFASLAKEVYSKTKKKKKRYKIILIILLIFFVFIFLSGFQLFTTGTGGGSSNVDGDLSNNIGDMLDGIDLGDLQSILDKLTDQQKNLFGGTSFLDKIKSIVSGDMSISFSSFVDFIFSLLGIGFLNFLPVVATIISISLAYNIISSIKGKFARESTDKIIYFVCVGAITAILLTVCGGLIVQTKNTVSIIKNISQTTFPILLTMMTAIGASSSAAVYQPSVAIFSVTLVELISMIALPVFIISFVLSIVGNLSDGVRLKQMGEFFNSVAKWLLGTMFFLFLAFLSIQGVTASVFDGISVRTAKFAIAKYIPIIGGYLSDGLNLVMAGGVLIKNAVGLSVILVMFATVLPLIVNLVTFSLMLKLAAAITEPLGDTKIPKILAAISKQCSILAVIIIALGFLFFIFLLLIICTGNLVI